MNRANCLVFAKNNTDRLEYQIAIGRLCNCFTASTPDEAIRLCSSIELQILIIIWYAGDKFELSLIDTWHNHGGQFLCVVTQENERESKLAHRGRVRKLHTSLNAANTFSYPCETEVIYSRVQFYIEHLDRTNEMNTLLQKEAELKKREEELVRKEREFRRKKRVITGGVALILTLIGASVTPEARNKILAIVDFLIGLQWI